jgi:Malectin domain
VFKVSVQGKLISAAVDVVATAGADKMYEVIVTATATDAAKTIEMVFENIKENSMISGIEIIPVVSPSMPMSQPTPISFLRINAGSEKSWTDPAGLVWAADQYFDTGGAFSMCPQSVDGTDLDMLFCSERFYGDGLVTSGGYKIPIETGDYIVKLMLAEVFFTTPTSRVFDVAVQGITIKKGLDIVAEAGPKNAYILTTPVTVTVAKKSITIEFTNLVQNSKISAIEILAFGAKSPLAVPVPVPVTTPIPPSPITPLAVPLPSATPISPILQLKSLIRINAGSMESWTDPSGLVWSADMDWESGGSFNSCPQSVNGDTLYCSERFYGGGPGISGGYNIPVQAGEYVVKLMFAEVFFTTPKSRIFDVSVQCIPLTKNFDIVAAVGPKTAYVLNTTVTIDTSIKTLKIPLRNIVENAKISAIEILSVIRTPVTVPAPGPDNVPFPILTPFTVPTPVTSTVPEPEIRINAGSGVPWIDPETGLTWVADTIYQVNGYPFSDCAGVIAGTNQDGLYCTNRVFFGPPNAVVGGYVIPVKPGSYTVNLMFAETYFENPKGRVFDVQIQGNPIVQELDIFAATKGKNVAYVLSINAIVSFTSPSITINLINKIDNAMVNAIHILPVGSTPTAPFPVVIPIPVVVPKPTPVTIPSLAPIPMLLPAPVPVPIAVEAPTITNEKIRISFIHI